MEAYTNKLMETLDKITKVLDPVPKNLLLTLVNKYRS